MPRPDPVGLAFSLIIGEVRTSAAQRRGGLWVTGDQDEAIARLRWIAGSENADLVSLDEDGRVRLDRKALVGAVDMSKVSPLEAPLALTEYITDNEGLLLLVQLTQGTHRYRLHIGQHAPTLGAPVEVGGSVNLDNNYDSRINPYRRLSKKLDTERPPAGFDALIAINPVARWFNLRSSSLVPVGHITFHELAEAQAKVDLNLDYLVRDLRPGAHNTAIEREWKLKSQRPLSGVVLTSGSNRVLRTEEEFRHFYSQGGAAGLSQR